MCVLADYVFQCSVFSFHHECLQMSSCLTRSKTWEGQMPALFLLLLRFRIIAGETLRLLHFVVLGNFFRPSIERRVATLLLSQETRRYVWVEGTR